MFFKKKEKTEYEKLLVKVYDQVTSNPNDPVKALSILEPMLLGVYTNYDKKKVEQLSALGIELDEHLSFSDDLVSPVVISFCEGLSTMDFEPSEYNKGVAEMLIWLRDIIKSSAA